MSVLLLGAGFGNRLRPLTDDRPKCVVEIAGEPLAVRILRQFAERGERRATVVVGHFADRARALIGTRVGALEVSYVENTEFATTNTMYSTLLGMRAMEDTRYVVEGDIVASDGVIDTLMSTHPDHAYWAVDAWTARHSGSRLRTREPGDDRIVGQDIWRGATTGSTANLWKSAGMLSLGPYGAASLRTLLEREAAEGNRNVYYDNVIGKYLVDFFINIVDLKGAPWVEIDDHDDMAQAQRLFATAHEETRR